MRRKRAETDKARKQQMKEEWEQRKAASDAARVAELQVIQEKEQELKSREEVTGVWNGLDCGA
jgi:hypothetical protein